MNEFAYLTDDTYTKEDVLRMEHLILKVLDFQMNVPTVNCFLLYFLHAFNMNQRIEHLSRVSRLSLLELSRYATNSILLLLVSS